MQQQSNLPINSASKKAKKANFKASQRQKPLIYTIGWLVLMIGVSFLLSKTAATFQANSPEVEPVNVILFIADGMGFEHADVASIYATGQRNQLNFQQFPHQAEVITVAADTDRTDSAAAASAMATGQKVNKGVVSIAIPGTGESLPTIMEQYQAAGKWTGLVTTSHMTDASVAAFMAHTPSRIEWSNIAEQYLQQSRPNVLFGGGGHGITVADAAAHDYLAAFTKTGMASLPNFRGTHIAAFFGEGHMPSTLDGRGDQPTLEEMTETALTQLEYAPNGFFLIVEQQLTDSYSHANDIDRVMWAALELADAVEVATQWADGREHTVIIVISDHETGLLDITANNGAGQMPDVSWGSPNHSSRNAPLYALGFGAEQLTGTLDNTQLREFIHGISFIYDHQMPLIFGVPNTPTPTATFTPTATSTPLPTLTPSPTWTPSPTFTPTGTITPTVATATWTPTPTNTVEP